MLMNRRGGESLGQAGEQGAKDERRLGIAGRVVFSTGDLTVNAALGALSIVYSTYFLTQVAGLRPFLAGLVPLLGRTVDALTDPAIGRLSDHTRLPAGRRRPYFLIGAIPFGLCFGLLWVQPGFESQIELFAYYATIYCLVSLFMTVVSVPYLALVPEMATDYDDRTSLNTYRSVGSILGTFGAIALRPVAGLFGGGLQGFAMAGALYGVLIIVPWLAIYRVTFERPAYARRPSSLSLVEGFRLALRRRSFVRLMAFYLSGRMAMDFVSSMLILFFTYWLGRGEDFEGAMALFLVTTVLALPAWLRLSLRRDKAEVFRIGCLIWMVVQTALLFVTPETPPWVLYAGLVLAAVGFGVVDLMPWAMLGEVIDEDELETGERREGLYNGLFMFLRKLAGAVVVFLLLGLLDLLGFEQGLEQNETVRVAILILSTLAPAAALAASIFLARNYPITREAHEAVLQDLERQRTGSPGS